MFSFLLVLFGSKCFVGDIRVFRTLHLYLSYSSIGEPLAVLFLSSDPATDRVSVLLFVDIAVDPNLCT